MKNPKPDSKTRARTRNRRLSACYRHPDERVTGICASCLRERLSGLDSSGDPSTIITTTVTLPELRRCRSVSAAKSEASCSYNNAEQPRRKSCDVRARNTLSDLFDVDDENNAPIGSASLESKNLGLCKFSNEVIETIEEDKIGEEARVSDDTLPQNVAIGDDFEDDNVEGGEVKTMKELIDLETQSKNVKPKDSRNLWEAASVFSKKLRKWRQKQSNKELSEENVGGIDGNNGKYREFKPRKLGEVQLEAVDYALGRRSCDIDPRLQLDAGRISFDEHRASWDGGYVIDRNTPKHGRMLSVVENGMLGAGNRFDSHRLSVDGQMQSIIEDESSSRGSGQSNSDDSSSSQRRSSFDRSSSVRSFSKKAVGLESDEANSVVNVTMSPQKLVITERELKDWRLKSVKDDDSLEKFEPVSKVATSLEAVGNLYGSKKSTRWRKMRNVLGFRSKSSEKKSGNSTGNAVDSVIAEGREKQGGESGGKVIEASVFKLMRSGSVASSRKSFDMVRLNQSIRNEEEVREASVCNVASSRRSFDVVRLNQSIRSREEEASVSKLTRIGTVASTQKSLDMVGLNESTRNGQDVKEAAGWKLTRSGSVSSSRRSFDMIGLNRGISVVKDSVADNNGREDFVLELNKSTKNSLCKIDDDVLPFYLTPLRGSKSGRHRPQN